MQPNSNNASNSQQALMRQQFAQQLARAEQHDANAQANVGYMYQKGLGVRQNNAQAFHWLSLAAAARVPSAMAHVGKMYAGGEGLPQNDTIAVEWFRQAARLGSVSAQCNLGIMYKSGRGVAQNNTAAVYWLRQAAAQQYAQAIDLLDDMHENDRVPSDAAIDAFGAEHAQNPVPQNTNTLTPAYEQHTQSNATRSATQNNPPRTQRSRTTRR